MSIKSKSRKIGRMIRRITGIHLTTAMKIGKMVAQNKSEYEIMAKHPDLFQIKLDRCGDGCCSWSSHILRGPKSNIESRYTFNESDIVFEYNQMVKILSA